MEIGDMLYKNISEMVGDNAVSLGFEFKNDRLIVRVESLVSEEKDTYEGIKSL
jgi:hypothetical protein